MGQERRQLITIAILGLLIGAGIGLVALTESMIAGACGERPTARTPFAAVQLLFGVALSTSCGPGGTA